MTWLIALGPLALTPLVGWLLMEFGPERSVIFALYWLVPSIVFACAFPILRRRGRSLQQASVFAIAWAILITAVVFAGLFFGFTPATAAVPTVVERQALAVHTPPSGSTDDHKPYTPFARRVRERARNSQIPAALFPHGFLTSDVPVE